MKKTEIVLLLQNYGRIINDLRKAGILRSGNNPVADYAEYLVSQTLGLNLESNSKKSFDAIDFSTKLKYQIKSRRVTKFSNSRQLGVIRSLDFDFLIAVIFREDFSVLEAYKIPVSLIKTPFVRFSKHQNGFILNLKGNILLQKDVEILVL